MYYTPKKLEEILNMHGTETEVLDDAEESGLKGIQDKKQQGQLVLVTEQALEMALNSEMLPIPLLKSMELT